MGRNPEASRVPLPGSPHNATSAQTVALQSTTSQTIDNQNSKFSCLIVRLCSLHSINLAWWPPPIITGAGGTRSCDCTPKIWV